MSVSNSTNASSPIYSWQQPFKQKELTVPENYLVSFSKTTVTMPTDFSSKSILVQLFPTHR